MIVCVWIGIVFARIKRAETFYVLKVFEFVDKRILIIE